MRHIDVSRDSLASHCIIVGLFEMKFCVLFPALVLAICWLSVMLQSSVATSCPGLGQSKA